MIKRRELSLLIKNTLNDANVKNITVGYGKAPRGAGWDGQPNKNEATFKPYAVINPLTSSGKTNAQFSSTETGNDWQLPYSVSAFGVIPDQAELVADEMRTVIETLEEETIALGDETYEIRKVTIESIGALQRVDATDPEYYGQVDVVTIWIGAKNG